MQHTQTIPMACLEFHSSEPEEKEVSHTLCVDVVQSGSLSSESREWHLSVDVHKPADEVSNDGPFASGMDNEHVSYRQMQNCVLPKKNTWRTTPHSKRPRD